MKKEFIVSRIEATQDGSPYIYLSFSDPASASESRQRSPSNPLGAHAFAFTSPEDMMKNLPKAFSNMMGGMGPSESPTLKLSMREYEDMGLKVGDRVTLEIKRVDSVGV